MTTRLVQALAAGLLATVFPTTAFAQYEYSTTYQPNLSQIKVTQKLHSDLSAFISGSTAAKLQAQNVGIAILDGIADPNHVDLNGRLTISQVYSGVFTRSDQHGTHVAGIAGAGQNATGIVGVAPTAKLISIPVFDDTRWIASDLGKLALNRAQQSGAKAVNMSYGPTARGDVFLNGELNVFDDYRTSMVLVRAAGNTGANAGNESYAGTASTALSHLLIVGSVDSNNVISSFSNRPGNACISSSSRCSASERMSNFFIVAPGRNILSDLPGNALGYMSGTSMAAPHVAGAAALVFQNAFAGNKVLTPAEVASILKRSATDLGTAGVDSVYGWGLLNVTAALGPVGTTTIATTSTVEGSTTKQTGSSSLAGSSALGRSAAFEDVLNGMVVFDDYGRGFVMQNVKLAGPRSTLADDSVTALGASLLLQTDVRENEDSRLSLFQSGDQAAGFSGFSYAAEGYSVASAAGNTQAYFSQMSAPDEQTMSHRLGTQFFTGAGDIGQSFTSGFASGLDVSIAPSITVSALYAHGSDDVFNTQSDWTNSLTQGDSTNSLAALGAALSLGNAGTLAISYGLLREEDAMLGIQSEGAFSLGEMSFTQMMGFSYSAKLSETLGFDAFAQFGMTSTAGGEDTIFGSVSDVWSTKMGLSLTGSGLLQASDTFQVALVSPWRIVQGDVEANVAVGREFDGTVNYDVRRVSLAGGDVPLDLGLTYMMSSGALSYGASLWLRDADVEELGVNEAVLAAGFGWRY